MPNTPLIRELNDKFRKTLIGGRVLITRGVSERKDVTAIIEKVKTFDQFDEQNDPHDEHDFGSLKIGGVQVFFKIDYYDADLSGGSLDPADETVTMRMLIIMLAVDY